MSGQPDKKRRRAILGPDRIHRKVKQARLDDFIIQLEADSVSLTSSKKSPIMGRTVNKISSCAASTVTAPASPPSTNDLAKDSILSSQGAWRGALSRPRPSRD